MGDFDAAFVEPTGPFLGATGRCEHDGNLLLGNDFHQFGGLWPHERHVHTKVVGCRLTALDDVLPQDLGGH